MEVRRYTFSEGEDVKVTEMSDISPEELAKVLKLNKISKYLNTKMNEFLDSLPEMVKNDLGYDIKDIGLLPLSGEDEPIQIIYSHDDTQF